MTAKSYLMQVRKARVKIEQMKRELEQEYQVNKEPSDEFNNAFCQKYDVQSPI